MLRKNYRQKYLTRIPILICQNSCYLPSCPFALWTTPSHAWTTRLLHRGGVGFWWPSDGKSSRITVFTFTTDFETKMNTLFFFNSILRATATKELSNHFRSRASLVRCWAPPWPVAPSSQARAPSRSTLLESPYMTTSCVCSGYNKLLTPEETPLVVLSHVWQLQVYEVVEEIAVRIIDDV